MKVDCKVESLDGTHSRRSTAVRYRAPNEKQPATDALDPSLDCVLSGDTDDGPKSRPPPCVNRFRFPSSCSVHFCTAAAVDGRTDRSAGDVPIRIAPKIAY